MLYLSGVTNARIQGRLVAAGAGVLVQPGSGYVGRVGAFPAFAAEERGHSRQFWITAFRLYRDEGIGWRFIHRHECAWAATAHRVHREFAA